MRLDALVINLNRFGDLLLSQPLLHDLHRAGRGTTLLCLEKYADTEGLLQFASPLLTVPDRLVSPEQADATRHELQAWARALRADVQADHIINLTPSMSARLLATTLAPAPEAVLGFGLDHKGRPRVDGLWPAFLHAAELRQSNAPFNLADMFRMTGAPLLGGLSGELLSQPGSGLLSELGTEARETARRLLAHAPVDPARLHRHAAGRQRKAPPVAREPFCGTGQAHLAGRGHLPRPAGRGLGTPPGR